MEYDVVVIGGGPAGIGAAIKAVELNLRTILLENREVLGGIPLQCIHPGFGVHYFKEDLTGTQFITRLLDKLENLGVEYVLKTYVHSVDYVDYYKKIVNVISPRGILKLTTKTIIYAVGARERHLFELGIVGDRPDGVYTAGEAQTLMDIYGVIPGKEVVIVGSGDVGLIMARRFALEGAKVKAVIEILPYPGGLMRNVMQCLIDFDIPLLLQHTVVRVVGRRRVEKVVIAKVDEKLKPIEGTEFEIPCDTLVISAGLRPNTDLLEKIGVAIDPATGGPIVNEYLETSIPGIFVAGNALVVNDLVDYVVEQGELAAEGAKIFVENKGLPTKSWKRIEKGRNIRLVIPHMISGEEDVVLYARVAYPERNIFIEIPEINFKQFSFGVRPAEMIRLKLEKNILSKTYTNIDRITLAVKPRWGTTN
ncbi:MAG: FAD-dependent oxidoreductase [Ignisphaera sp.]|uniref:FAD-dependent oxidoreductase n=1 Tax=Ignisphaera aggregans TaxID=334771 RepID=A0A7C4JL65_9CREN